MRRSATASLTGLLVLAAAAPAGADPGAVDRGFGRSGRVVFGPETSIALAVPVAGDRLAITGATFDRDVSFLGPGGRVLPLGRRRGPGAVAVLSDGRYLTLKSDTERTVLARRRPSGALDRTYAAGGTVRLGRGAEVAAVSPGGRVVEARRSERATALRVFRADGTRDAAFGTRRIEGSALLAFDGRGRLVVTSRPSDGPGVVRRLLLDGRDDPAFALQAVSPTAVATAPSGGRVAVLDGDPSAPRPLLLDGGGSPIVLSSLARRALAPAQAAVFDRQDRLVVSDGRRLKRIAADGQRVELLRARLPDSRFGLRIRPAAIDRRGRIVLAGYERLDGNRDPGEAETCDFCREDVADYRGVVLRLEGGVQRVAITTRRRGRTVPVLCQRVARERCAGSLVLRVADRAAVRRRISIAPGRTRRFTVPAALLRSGRALEVEVRIVDGSGELSTSHRVLRGSTPGGPR